MDRLVAGWLGAIAQAKGFSMEGVLLAHVYSAMQSSSFDELRTAGLKLEG